MIRQAWQRFQCRRGRHTLVRRIGYNQMGSFGPWCKGLVSRCRWCHHVDWSSWRTGGTLNGVK